MDNMENKENMDNTEKVESTETTETVENMENSTVNGEPEAVETEAKPKKKKKGLIIAIACIALVAIVAGVLCAVLLGKDSVGGGDDETVTGDMTTYSVTLKTVGGMALSEIDVYIYLGEELDDMQDYAKTDEEGKVTFNLAESDKYAIVLSGVAKGYDVAESYTFDGTNADIVLTSSLISDEDLSTATLGLGDVMYDFTVSKIDGTEITLSEVLKEKKLVMLNFWYSTCGPCVSEFPIISDVYETYKEDVEIIALNNLIMDQTVENVQAFQNTNNLPFPIATCPSSWSNTFGITGYPTSIFIDRYGVICLVEVGAVTSKRPWVCAYDHFTADDYEQKLCENGVNDLLTQIKPSYEMATSEEIAAIINSGHINVTYRPETDEDTAEYTWPFIEGEKLGRTAVYASNKDIDDSYAIMYCDVELKTGQALGFDYLISSEHLCDILYVIVDDEDVFQISGVSEEEKWQTCYPVVADKDATYEVALCYLKDSDGADGEDTVYIDNMRVVDKSAIDVDTYLPRYAATTEDDETYSYVDIVYNENDGYYHVGDANGPLLLVDMMDYTQFNEEQTLQEIVTAGDADKDGVSLYDKPEEGGLNMVKYFSYASNSSLQGVCTVNKELAEMLKQVAEVAGFSDDPNEWLKLCKYFQAYGPDTKQLEDPIKGLCPASAFTTTLGKDIPTNYFYYNRAILPRGLMSEFIPDNQVYIASPLKVIIRTV